MEIGKKIIAVVKSREMTIRIARCYLGEHIKHGSPKYRITEQVQKTEVWCLAKIDLGGVFL